MVGERDEDGIEDATLALRWLAVGDEEEGQFGEGRVAHDCGQIPAGHGDPVGRRRPDPCPQVVAHRAGWRSVSPAVRSVGSRCLASRPVGV